MKQLTEHFSLEELCASEVALRKGLDNTPDADVEENLLILARGLERVRTIINDAPMHSLSGYRCLKVNIAVGGTTTSAHLYGYADDFVAPSFGTPQDVCKAIWHSDLEFDQLIYEGTWVHISFDPRMRRQVLTAHFSGGKVTYTVGID